MCAVTSQVRVCAGVLLSACSVIVMLESTHSYCCDSCQGDRAQQGCSSGLRQDRASSARALQCCQGSTRQHAPSLAAQRQACSGSPQHGPSPKMGSRLPVSGAGGGLYTTSASTGPLQRHWRCQHKYAMNSSQSAMGTQTDEARSLLRCKAEGHPVSLRVYDCCRQQHLAEKRSVPHTGHALRQQLL